ncbi:LPS-assembly protein LptD [Aquamicrobium segne]|uniref:LPS-assembly protein LptD n=1 Tax=Aquamicrobium segne TaxID=469547 RepID=A0ABW0GV55_9HYPH
MASEGAVLNSGRLFRLSLLCGVSGLACLLASSFAGTPALAQNLSDLAQRVPSDAQMLLESDTLVYDNDRQTVTAIGGVQIDYAGNRLVAERVEYDRKTQRLVASGKVEIVESSGTRISSEHIDITDDFADGFVNALHVETVDKTYFAAESAERMGGMLTTFHNGVYTACEPCEDKPDKPAIWRIKSQSIIWNSQKKTIRFQNSNFEFFGMPIAYLPAFEIADPTVKRKSGFLFPSLSYKSRLGVGASIPYYFALSPTYDLTVKGNYYSKQGFLGEAEWRQRFNNGEYNLKIAGIHQQNPDAFKIDTENRGENDDNKFRGMMGTQGRFAINSRWDFGWDVLLQTDKNFSRTYDIEGFDDYVHRSEVYLTGLNDRNYFDLRGMKFQIQEDILKSDGSGRDEKQPWVLPSFDYAYIPDASLAGGQLSFNVNARAISRDRLHEIPGNERILGISGESGRLTAEAEWKRSFITDGGMVLTPLLAFQADANYLDASSGSLDAINQMASSDDMRSSFFRSMATLGLEWRWPILFSATASSHVLEPVAQLFMRPNEDYVGGLAVPNEDAQSFVFDASTLFERDKFSGYDRIEGGTRANIGMRYVASFDNGWSANALFGQSYHLGGENSFAAPDLVNVGANSGLESDRSDYVGMVGFSAPNGISASLSGRFDEENFNVRRTEAKLGYSDEVVSLSARYAFIEKQPDYGFTQDRHEASFGASTQLADNWRIFGSGTYDLEEKLLVKNGIGFGYADECFTFLMTYSQSRDRVDREVSQTVGFNITFRTLGDFGSSSASLVQ